MGSTSSPPAPRKPSTSQTPPIPCDPTLAGASGHCPVSTSPSPDLGSAPATNIQSSNIETVAEHYQQLNLIELGQLLALRDREIRALKFELEKYKLALYQSQLDYHHYIQEHGIEDSQTKVASNVENIVAEQHNLLQATTTKRDQKQSQSIVVPLMSSESVETLNKRDLHDLIASGAARADKSNAPLEGARIPQKQAKVVFRTGDDDDDDNLARVEKSEEYEDETGDIVRHLEEDDDQLENIIHDVAKIDLSSKLDDSKRGSEKKQGKKARAATSTTSVSIGTTSEQNQKFNDSTDIPGATKTDQDSNGENDDENEDIMTDGLLTSLTDAAISNLSQLAALQERCESQQQYHQQSAKPQHQQQQGSNLMTNQASSRTNTPASVSIPDEPAIGRLDRLSNRQAHEEFSQHDPFSTSSIASQAAIAINAAAVAAAIIPPTPMANLSQQRPVSSSSSLSPNSTIQADLSSTQSLASVVAAAAVAAAAANQEQEQDHHQHAHHTQQQQLHHHHHQLNPQNTSRLITSASPSSEFYHSLQQQHAHNIHSPVSSLHFSPSTSVTPSPSLLAQSRRSVASNASSSLMSPIVSPNYLRRQFMPDRIPLLSPSPTSCLTTASSSGASSSLAHLLHQQQRSASAFGGSGSGSGTGGVMTSASSTPLSSGGSTAISPLMTNKNSSQARLNNMQIRHKFGYLGSGRAQFNSPHGFCLGLNQEIVVADTNNHRVCIFDKNGTYITQFGSPGKEEGQLWNPRKVAILHRSSTGSLSSSPPSSGVIGGHNLGTSGSNGIVPSTTTAQQSHISLHHHNQQTISSPYSSHIPSGANNLQQGATISGQSISSYGGGANQHLSTSEPLYVVCDRGAERSRMQLFTKDGAFIKKIGIHYIDIVAGLAITQNGLIIVVDSVSPTVYIINGETGILNGWFDCSGHMKEPSDIAVKSDLPGNEYFICDFKGHCVVVFSEQGEYLRKIGHDNLTSYPNGIDISDDGDILVGDSHGNRFHVVVFDRNGNFVSQFECPHVKVSRCCGLKITREGYIVTLAKNNHHVLVLDTIHI